MLYYIQLLNPDGSNHGAPIETSTLGIEDIEFQFNNLAADTWTFTIGGKAIDAAQLWPYGQLMAIQDADGNRVAFGRIEPWTRQGAPDAQNHTGRLVNPFWYLTKLIYQQRYSIAVGPWGNVGQINPPATQYQVFTTPRVVLNILFSGQHQQFYSATTGQQIADAINYAISLGAPIQLGVTDPSTQPFSDFKKGVICSEVISLMFHKEPDFVWTGIIPQNRSRPCIFARPAKAWRRLISISPPRIFVNKSKFVNVRTGSAATCIFATTSKCSKTARLISIYPMTFIPTPFRPASRRRSTASIFIAIFRAAT